MSGIYVDSSAVLKRIFAESGGPLVEQTLLQRSRSGDVVATSSLTWIETARAVLRSGIGDVDTMVEQALAGVAELALGDAVLQRARRIGPSTLRSLDAIHLASVLTVGADTVLTFDERLASAANSIGVKAIP